ncbi:XdhC family protein [Kineosporia rhizophila]|uniref:XdhC family protein n=1 Tax=Kineosporia TaxID=49184 RepID=UPI001E40C808|nr:MULTISPECIES: XdhC/CoxI family protein [Kineosporia]MCE0533979.1 XdhC family protein [Kineosporia rhizophila]GLY13519.1 xanthine dehydrogenase accessory factor [Kineosporia sp. NBRC 101677]
MRELLTGLDRWRAQGRRWALARVVDVDGSGPREPGAAMAVNQDGEVLGSVSGGCVEGAVVAAALELIERDECELVSFGYSDDDALAVGLTCGGTIHLLIQPAGRLSGYDRLAEAVRAGEPVALLTTLDQSGATAVLCPGRPLLGSLGNAELDRVVARDAEGELGVGSSRVRRYGPRGEARRSDVSVFVQSFLPPARMIIFGAVDFAAALSQVASVLGFRVTLCDAREMFATRARFPHADEVVVDWPHRLLGRIGPTLTRRDAICVLTHEAKFDVPAVLAALRTEVGYLGAMGSRRTHEDRLSRLRAAGAVEADLARLHSPIGLDLGARTPEETAVSICAEIIAERSGVGLVQPLGRTQGPIHHQWGLARAIGE